jgi:hypothetical protein
MIFRIVRESSTTIILIGVPPTPWSPPGGDAHGATARAEMLGYGFW